MTTTYEYIKAWRARQPNLREQRREEARKRRERYPEKVRQQVNTWNAKNREKVNERSKLAARAYRKTEKYREQQRLRQIKFKTKLVEQRALVTSREQTTFCELCKEDCKTVWDHDHTTGKFRGWLCDRCNRVLGSVKDSSKLLFTMIEYLESNNGEVNNKAEGLSTKF